MIFLTPVLRALRAVAYLTHTAFLFTKSEIKTTVIPITLIAAASAPLVSLHRIPHLIFWIWFHVLQCDVPNQIMQPEEDAMNKKDRPLPAGRISLHQAIILRVLLVPLCVALSACYSVETIYASIFLVLWTILYNELSAHRGHWVVRNAVNAIGFTSIEVGATLVAGVNPHSLDNVGILSLAISAGIFATTIHAQDFKDEPGDRAIGRRTLPIALPSIARYTVIIPLMMWSTGLSLVWQLDPLTTLVFVGLAFVVGARYLSVRTVDGDEVSYYWYNVWLSAAHALPGYYRLLRGASEN